MGRGWIRCLDMEGVMGAELIGTPAADRREFASLIAARICLERRKTHPIGGHPEDIAFIVYNNSHRFRRRGIDGRSWRFSHE